MGLQLEDQVLTQALLSSPCRSLEAALSPAGPHLTDP